MLRIQRNKLMFYDSAFHQVWLNRNFLQRWMDKRVLREDHEQTRMETHYKFPHIGHAIIKDEREGNQIKIAKTIDMMAQPKLSVVFAGQKGTGKTVFSYWAAEKLHEKYGFKVCMYSPLSFREDLMPDYFYEAYSQDEIEPNSFIVFDEAQIFVSSRRSTSKENVDFSSFLTIQRHTGNPALVIQQVMQMSDINIFRLADYLIVKGIGLIQLQHEAKRRKEMMYKFLDFMRPLNNEETLFMTTDLKEMITFTNTLPSFWTEALSTPAARLTFDEAKAYCRRLLEKDVPVRDIQKRLKLKGHNWTPEDVKFFGKGGGSQRKPSRQESKTA